MTLKIKTFYLFIFLSVWAGIKSEAQTALCKSQVTKSMADNSCLASITFADIDDGSSDFNTYSLSETELTGPGTFQVTLTVTDVLGNTSSCVSNVDVIDDTPPVPYVRSQVYVTLNMDNTLTLTPDMFDAGSFDNCSGISDMTVIPDVVSCNDISPVTVEVRIYDNAGNWDYATTFVHLSNAQNSVQTLACNDNMVVALSAGETREIFTNDILEGGPYKCWEEYDLDILENNVVRSNNVVSSADVQKNLVARVKDITTNITCWATVRVVGPSCSQLYICDTKSRCDTVGDCQAGHSLSDDVEWPCDQLMVNVPVNVYNNPTPQALANFAGQDIEEWEPFLYNGDSLCNQGVAKAYQDTYVNSGGGRLINRLWTVIHWSSSQTYSYLQKISINSLVVQNCYICDYLAWNTPLTDCSSGHSDMDAVEWPGDLTVTGMRMSPVDLSYEPGILANDVKPILRGECQAFYQTSYSDVVYEFSPDSILIERTWILLHTSTNVSYSYTQDILLLNPLPIGNVKVCVRQRNGEPLNDVVLYPGNVIDNGPCKEFDYDPAFTLVRPSKASTDYLAGVDLADLILLNEHILAIRRLEPSQVLAGDFNGNDAVTTLDLLFITKMINGEQVDLSQWPSPWKFMVEDLYPSLQNVRNQVSLQSFNTPLNGHHFIGYKLGDVNNSYLENNLPAIPVQVFDDIITAGETYTIPFYSNDEINANGIQFKILKTGKTEIKEIQSRFFEKFDIAEYDTYYSVIGHNQNFAASGIKQGDLFLNITIKALQNSILSEALTLSDDNHNKFILAGSYASLPFEIIFEDVISSNKDTHFSREISLFPNPAYDVLNIQGLSAEADIEIRNMTGHVMLAGKKHLNDAVDISVLVPGVYVLNIKSPEGVTKAMRFVKF